MDECKEVLEPYHAQLLPEIHEHYFIQKKLEEKVIIHMISNYQCFY